MHRQTLKEEADICNRLDQLGITMFGRRIHNPLPLQGKRVSYDIHPYTKQGTGVSCTITYTDAKTKIPYVLLAKKKNKNQYDQIGGYTRGQGPEGSDVSYDKRCEDERDKEEEALIGNTDAVKVEQKEGGRPSGSAQTAYSLKQLKEASMKGFLEQQKLKPGKRVNPILMKEMLASQGIIYSNDYNSWETALRETKEETGLDLSHHKPKELYTSDDFGVSNEDERLHTKTTHYLFHLGTLSEPPVVKSGSDVEQLKWVAATDIELADSRVKDDLPIRKSYVLQTLPRALKKVRELELASATNNIFVKYKSVGAHTISDPFSREACDYHQAVLEKAIKASRFIKPQLEGENFKTKENPFSFWVKAGVTAAVAAAAGFAFYNRNCSARR